MTNPSPIKLEFSKKYDHTHAYEYFLKHQTGLARRLSHWRDLQLARHALKIAGNPELVLDLPCGAGRFWPLLCEQPNRVLLAADNSDEMLAVAEEAQSHKLPHKIPTFRTSAFDIKLGENAVDCIFCMRLLHHIQHTGHRQAMLKEFHRVTRDTLIISLWVDGNYKAWKRRRLEAKRALSGHGAYNQNRFVISRHKIESEFRQAGFSIIGSQDFLPGYAMWRVYTLRKQELWDTPREKFTV